MAQRSATPNWARPRHPRAALLSLVSIPTRWRVMVRFSSEPLKAIVCAIVLVTPGIGLAQTVSSLGNASMPVVEVAATVSGTYPTVVLVECCQLRTPPILKEADARYKVVSLGAVGRVYWTPRLSVLADVRRSREASYEVTFPRPLLPPPPLIPAFGIRVYVGDRLFVSGDESLRWYIGEPISSSELMWRIGIGVRFGQ